MYGGQKGELCVFIQFQKQLGKLRCSFVFFSYENVIPHTLIVHKLIRY